MRRNAMNKNKGPVWNEPVPPAGMRIVFYYDCPNCGLLVSTEAPIAPATIACPKCGLRFPVMPVDQATVNYINLMTLGGFAMVRPDL